MGKFNDCIVYESTYRCTILTQRAHSVGTCTVWVIDTFVGALRKDARALQSECKHACWWQVEPLPLQHCFINTIVGSNADFVNHILFAKQKTSV